MDTTKFFVKEINSNISKGVTEMNELIESIQKVIPTKIRKQFTSKDEITTALICEYIMMS